MEKPPTRAGRVGRALVDCFQTIALFLLGATVVWAATDEYLLMFAAGRVHLQDILLLFIYLELGAMVGIYFKTDRLPVLFLLYVAITALTRFLVIDVKDLPTNQVLTITGAIFLLALAVLVLQVVASKFGSTEDPTATRY
jgi:phosphate starvation-inducible membrane PsiE